MCAGCGREDVKVHFGKRTLDGGEKLAGKKGLIKPKTSEESFTFLPCLRAHVGGEERLLGIINLNENYCN
jgi:hypothetical protein